jgi:hypothetical protein
MIATYTKRGWYVAICNTTNFDGHYSCLFFYPGQVEYLTKMHAETAKEHGCSVGNIVGSIIQESPGIYDASWWFFGKCNFIACADKVLPLEVFYNVEVAKELLLNLDLNPEHMSHNSITLGKCCFAKDEQETHRA